jgi:hypothetical protein
MNFLNYEITLQVISYIQNKYLLPAFQVQVLKWTGDSGSDPAKTSLMYWNDSVGRNLNLENPIGRI